MRCTFPVDTPSGHQFGLDEIQRNQMLPTVAHVWCKLWHMDSDIAGDSGSAASDVAGDDGLAATTRAPRAAQKAEDREPQRIFATVGQPSKTDWKGGPLLNDGSNYTSRLVRPCVSPCLMGLVLAFSLAFTEYADIDVSTQEGFMRQPAIAASKDSMSAFGWIEYPVIETAALSVPNHHRARSSV